MELYQYTARQLQQCLSDNEVTSEMIVNSFLAQIERVEQEIGAFITVTADQALEAAKESDIRRRRNELVSPWDGIPIAVKDNMSTKGIKTTCGSKILANYVPPYDGTVIRKLKAAGLPLLGKTNLDEFAMGSSTENSAFAKTCNPVNWAKVPGGSSGGSAAAVAGYEAPWSLGSDTGGSIRQPASFCGLIGLKPTYGLVSRYGLVAYASSFDQIGPLGRSVEDVADLMNIISGYDQLDSTSVNRDCPNYAAALTGDIKGLRIGLPKEYFAQGLNDAVKAAIMAAVDKLVAAGAVVEEVSLPMTEYAIETYYLITSAEASSNLARYDGVRYGLRVADEDSITMFKSTRSAGFGPEVKRRIMLGTYALSTGYYDAYYKKAQQVRTLMRREFAEAFAKVDILITPTTPTTAFGFGEKKNSLEMYLSDIYTVTVNLAGVPALSMPVGKDQEHLPIGMQLIGQHFAEEALLNTAYTLEQVKLKEGCVHE